MTTVRFQSRLLHSAAYDSATQELTLTLTSGKVYRYAEVPEACFAGLCAAKSAGQYYGTAIRGKYQAPVEDPYE